jgi:hypothetical protein
VVPNEDGKNEVELVKKSFKLKKDSDSTTQEGEDVDS